MFIKYFRVLDGKLYKNTTYYYVLHMLQKYSHLIYTELSNITMKFQNIYHDS